MVYEERNVIEWTAGREHVCVYILDRKLDMKSEQ